MSMSPPRDGPVDWGPSRTKQSPSAETDINAIFKRFTETGQLTHISAALGEYRDMSGIPDLHEAMNIVADAQSSFMELPAEIRKICGHDVSKFLPFIDNPENFDKCVELGLLPAKPTKAADLSEAKSVPIAQVRASVDADESPVQGGE